MGSSRFFVTSYRLFLGLLTFLAIGFQLISSDKNPNFQISNFFSFFTIESNILAAAIFILSALIILTRTKVKYHGILRGAATLYMVTTGIIYSLLLSGYQAELQTTVPWVNLVLHYIMPIALFADWLIDPPKKLITFRQMLTWLIFPVGYAIYSLIRGPIVDWYPYPFLNPNTYGYGGVLIYILVIAASVTLIALLVRAIGNFQAKRLKGKSIYNFDPEGV
jgi:hypothetical protein